MRAKVHLKVGFVVCQGLDPKGFMGSRGQGVRVGFKYSFRVSLEEFLDSGRFSMLIASFLVAR